MKILAIIQCRDNSTRCPGKALAEVNGLPVLGHIFARVLSCREIDGVVVSTSVDSPEIVRYCKGNAIPHYVGSENNLLSRHLSALLINNGDAMVRVTGDEIFIDPSFIDDMVKTYRRVHARRPDGLLMSNWHLERGVSEGLDLTIADTRVMTQLHDDPECPREDWISYAHKMDKKFVVWHHTIEAGGEELHLSMDTERDLDLARRMFARMGGNHIWDYAATLKAYAEVTG